MKLLPTIALLVLLSPLMGQAQLYVATTGSDTAAGTKEAPLASVATALRKVRELRRLNDKAVINGITVYVAGGTYPFYESLFLRPEDAGTPKSPTTIEALPGTKPVFSGGLPVGGWKKPSRCIAGLPAVAQGRVWTANAPMQAGAAVDFRQLWINGRKAIRAKAQNGDTMSRILSWNKKTEQCWIRKPAADISAGSGMEMMIHQWWAIANLRVKSATVSGDSVLLSFHQPESKIQSEHPWPAPWISAETGNSAFVLSNAVSFLDSPGEWFLDKKRGKIYYWPRAGEQMATALVVAPVLETLVSIQGTPERPVSHIRFKNISFQFTTWLRPSQKGHVPLQTGMYLLDAYKLKRPGTAEKPALENQAWVGRPAAAVSTTYSTHISFEGCRFLHIASTALDFNKGTQKSSSLGNIFRDIGGTAILAGTFSDEAMEAHLPYNPADSREQTSGLTIANNLVNDAANEDWGCVGIGAGFVKETEIAHNDLSDLPYTGISLGWGWTPLPNAMKQNKVTANRIIRYGRQLYDVAGIYTLSAQPGTVVANNYIDSVYKAPYAHLPSHWFYLYTDEGTSGVTVKNNWTPSAKFLQNANGPDNVWENNGPTAGEGIRVAAGLQPAWKHLLNEKAIAYPDWVINKERPVIIEVIGAGNSRVDEQKLKDVLAANGVKGASVYQWQNHAVVFEPVQDASVLRGKVQKAFPEAKINVYYDAFYAFDRSGCEVGQGGGEWEHVLFTANMVANESLQREYLDYHARQAKDWPEVAKGFCHAGFQQLLLYRNGRQLMLVISLPKGESLDKLNPKTTENNPRVVEWNKRMAEYQTGIDGTKKGEVWVPLVKQQNIEQMNKEQGVKK